MHSVPYAKETLVMLLGYALGCFTSGYYLVRWRTGDDIRWLGSGSVGATNVGRILGRPAGFCAHPPGVIRSGLFVDQRFWRVGPGAAGLDCSPQKYPG